MNTIFTAAILAICMFTANTSCAQADVELALFKAKAAITLEDDYGKYDEAIKLFEEAQKLDPENIAYPFEMAYAYSFKKDYKKASGILEGLLNHKDIYPGVYQALGNAFDEQGNSARAIDTYNDGLKKFPNSGGLYLELGNMQLAKKEYTKALTFFEKGIELDPAFPSNYYWATKIFLTTEEEVWGMIYGELFLNLERNGKRTAEVSKMLFNVYKNEINFSPDSSFRISFSKNAAMSAEALKYPGKFKLPFGQAIYEFNLSLAVVGEKIIDLSSLDRIRTRFLERYFEGENSKNYPNALFDYQQKVKEAGHLQAYNYWVLMSGDDAGFKKWQADNQTKWDAFLTWFTKNPMIAYKEHHFYRAQY